MKKLIPTLCMLLVAASLLGTSTFAWFSSNNEVYANNLSITAKAPSSLSISTDGTNFGSTVVLATDTDINESGKSPLTAIAYKEQKGTGTRIWYQLTGDGRKDVGTNGVISTTSNTYKFAQLSNPTTASLYVLTASGEADKSGDTTYYTKKSGVTLTVADDYAKDANFEAVTVNIEDSGMGTTYYVKLENKYIEGVPGTTAKGNVTQDEYFHDTFYLRIDGSTSIKSVNVEASYVTTPTVAIKGAIHLLFVEKTTGQTLDIDMGGTTTGTVTDYLAGNGGASEFDVYYYLSGTDSECCNNNLPSQESFSVTLKFTTSNAGFIEAADVTSSTTFANYGDMLYVLESSEYSPASEYKAGTKYYICPCQVYKNVEADFTAGKYYTDAVCATKATGTYDATGTYYTLR